MRILEDDFIILYNYCKGTLRRHLTEQEESNLEDNYFAMSLLLPRESFKKMLKLAEKKYSSDYNMIIISLKEFYNVPEILIRSRILEIKRDEIIDSVNNKILNGSINQNDYDLQQLVPSEELERYIHNTISYSIEGLSEMFIVPDEIMEYQLKNVLKSYQLKRTNY